MPLLLVQTRRLRYEIPISGKFTIIRGDSGTGKTTLIELLRSSKSKVDFEIPVRPLSDDNYYDVLFNENKTLYFCDEDNEYISTDHFQKQAVASPHVFLFVTRTKKLSKLAYGIDDVLVIEYNENRRVHVGKPLFIPSAPDVSRIKNVMTEDSKSGLQAVKLIYHNAESFGGRNNLPAHLLKATNTLFIVDGLSLGSAIADTMKCLEENRSNYVYAYKSFEAEVCTSKWISMNDTPPWDCANKEEWYTARLTGILRENDISYNKSTLPKCLYCKCCHKPVKCELYTRLMKLPLIFKELYAILVALDHKRVSETTNHFSS